MQANVSLQAHEGLHWYEPNNKSKSEFHSFLIGFERVGLWMMFDINLFLSEKILNPVRHEDQTDQNKKYILKLKIWKAHYTGVKLNICQAMFWVCPATIKNYCGLVGNMCKGANDVCYEHNFFTAPHTLHLSFKSWYFSIFSCSIKTKICGNVIHGKQQTCAYFVIADLYRPCLYWLLYAVGYCILSNYFLSSCCV